MAGRLNVHWYAVYVENPREAATRLDAATRQRLFDAQQMARDLGAEVHHIQADDTVDGILEFARANGVTDYRHWNYRCVLVQAALWNHHSPALS
jgi:K+-sensing histidine kinase KdpD